MILLRPGRSAGRAWIACRAWTCGLNRRFCNRLLKSKIQLKSMGRLPFRRPSVGFIERFGWRAFKSALGLGLVIIAGIGPVQRLLEFSSVEAVVNARLVTLRAPIEGRIEDADFAPTIGAMAPKGLRMFRISNSRADRARLDDLQRLARSS